MCATKLNEVQVNDWKKIDTFNVEGSESTCYSKLLDYQPSNDNEKKFRAYLEKAISAGIKSFKVPVNDPSVDENGNLQFIPGSKPAVGYSYDELEEMAEKNGLRLGTRNEYILFLGILIIKLIAEGWNESEAWNAVCYDSKDIGHYWNSADAKVYFEPTGSRNICGKCDLANTHKILAIDDEIEGFWVAGGNCYFSINNYPLADFAPNYNYDFRIYGGVGWFVC